MRNQSETHKLKMERKAARRKLWYDSTPAPLVMANISKNHRDYGMSPAEHEAAKRERKNNT